jgi:hypothetical protein
MRFLNCQQIKVNGDYDRIIFKIQFAEVFLDMQRS